MNFLLIFIIMGTIYPLTLPKEEFSDPDNFKPGLVEYDNSSLWILFINYSMGIATLDLAIFKQLVEWFVMLQLILVQKGKDYKEVIYELQDPSLKLKEKLKGIRYPHPFVRHERMCLHISNFLPVLYLALIIPSVFYCVFQARIIDFLFYRGIFEIVYLLYAFYLLLRLDH